MDSKLRNKIIIVSILLHVLFLLVWEGGIILNLFTTSEPPKVKAEEPIVFDLRQPDQSQAQPREVIETPDDAKVVKNQDKADYLSDKNALARNPETNPNVKPGEPFSRGIFETHELPKQEGSQGKTQEQPKADNQKTDREPKEQKQKLDEIGNMFANLLQKPQPSSMTPPGARERLPSVAHDNRDSSTDEMGGLSFNTYNWDYAPYMLMLKYRIQRNIYPPVAFTQLGMIDGETLLRFKIYPNGQMKDLEILGYNGHISLMYTSRNAVSSSAPFPELPKRFPEPFLEVTGKFKYFVRR